MGPALTSRFNFTFVEFKAGPKLTYDVDSVLNQINDKAFSSYKIDIDGEIGPSIDALKVLTNLKRYLKLKPVTPKVKILSVELDKSAKSDNFVIDNDNPAIGDSVEFFVHTDGCMPFSCAICTIENCEKRNSPFKQKLIWNRENILSDLKHQLV